ncbi:MAG: glycoside hydrolase family 5 protein [Sedimentisphaerales bacterium]|nr:glycoside hydrolase family 5 protein [Sedimentisphaerales bacterium]
MSLSNGLIIILFSLGLIHNVNGQAVAKSPENIQAKENIRKSVEVPFKRGVNLTNWLQGSNVREIQFTKFTKQDFINIKSLGCDVIRLPINLHSMTSDKLDYVIDPLLFYFLDQIIDWAEELELHLILDNHSFDSDTDTNPGIIEILVPVWTQIAQRYKDRSSYLYYEVLNEPHGISDVTWNTIQHQVVNAIRRIDQIHTIIVGPAGWNSYNHLKEMPFRADNNLIYTFHFYDPFLFTHQGASWTNPSMTSLAGVPFPYDADLMPPCPTELEDTWVEDRMANYHVEGTVEYVKTLIDIAADFQAARNVPLFCGEFGVYMPNSDEADRIYWYSIVRQHLEEKGIAWTTWDYTEGFGLFQQDGHDLFNYDLNIPLVEALGLNAPPQNEFVPTADANGFDIYLDYIGSNIIESSWMNQGLLDYYSEDNPASGNFCIHWTGVDQYNSISFRFSPTKDLSVLVDQDFAIELWTRCNDHEAKIDIRFVDTKTEQRYDHPWRMRYTLDENIAVWNDEWNLLHIPLNEFSEHGSWDDGWYNPIGAYDWTATERFEIVSEHSDLVGILFYFDNIRIVDPDSSDRL